nr:NAD(P)-dependent oxidoreductase [Halomonas socia]
MDAITLKQAHIGMVGVGLMGHGIASNVQNAGWLLHFLDHPGNQPVEGLVAQGAKAHPGCKSLAAECEVIILCVTGSPQVEEVLFREDGILAGIRPGSVVIDCSTSIPRSTVAIAQAVEQAGGYFMDAPMTRTPKEAAEGRLNLIVGGERELFEACLPLLQSYAEHITHAGPVGAGHKMKLLHNFVSLGFSTVLAEVAACAERGGIDSEVLVEVLAQGGGKGAILDRLSPYILSQDTSGFQFSLANAHKDLDYYISMATYLGAARQTALSIAGVFEEGIAARGPQTTVPELISILADTRGD